jgi:hypothetical protein
MEFWRFYCIDGNFLSIRWRILNLKIFDFNFKIKKKILQRMVRKFPDKRYNRQNSILYQETIPSMVEYALKFADIFYLKNRKS